MAKAVISLTSPNGFGVTTYLENGQSLTIPPSTSPLTVSLRDSSPSEYVYKYEDLSGKSFEELFELQTNLMKEIEKRYEETAERYHND